MYVCMCTIETKSRMHDRRCTTLAMVWWYSKLCKKKGSLYNNATVVVVARFSVVAIVNNFDHHNRFRK